MKLIISFRFLAVFAPLRGSTTFIFSSGETLAPVSEFSPPTITATNVDHPIHPDVRFIENPACKFGDVIVPARISSDFVISCESPDQDIIENNGNHSGIDSVSGASKVKFSVSLNGVDFFGDGLVYEYTKSPVVYSMSPRGNGGSVVVVRGKFFNPFHRDDFGISCQFGELMAKAVIVNDDKVTCVAPPQSEGTVQFRLVSQDLEILVNEFYDQTPLQYTYLPPVEIKSITPSFGTIHGNTMMLIELDWTAEHIQFRCIYGKNLASVVNVINGTMITCLTPPVKEPGWISFDVGIEDEENLTILTPISAQYRYVVEPTIKSIYPPRGAMSGGSLVTISGENFHYHDKQSVHCRFGNQTAPAVFATDNEVQCRSPAVDKITREVQAVRLVGEPIRDEVQEIRIVGTPIAREIQWIIVESSESREAPQVVRVLLTASTGMEGYFKLTYRGFASEPIGVKAAPEEVENCLTSGLFESVGVKRALDESIYGDYSAFDVSFYSVPGGVDLADMSCDRSAVTSKWSGDIQCSIVEIVPSSTSLVDGSFQLTVFDFDGNELPIILSVESTAYYLEQKLSSFIGSDVSVTKSKWPFTSISKSGFIWMVTFPSFHHSSSRIPLADWPLITVEDISLSGTDTRLHAVEHVKGNWVEGSFSLSIDGIESDPIPFDSSADDVQAILNEIALVAGNVVVVQSSSLQGITWLCTFPGMGNVIDLVPNSDDLVGDLGIVTVKTISQGSDPLEGKFKLSFNGVLTDPISLPSSVLELKQKISVLPIGDFTISVETAFDNNYPHFQVENSFLITFTGFINDEQPLLSIDASWVSNGATILVERIRSLCCRVALSLNGVDYFSRNNEALIFAYDKKIAAVSIAPQFGSIEGGTGVNLTVIGLSHSTVESDSSTLYCVFGEVEVIGVLADDMTVSCIAPAYGIEATVMVGVKFNGKLSESRASFGFVPEPIIDFISPESLPSINISTVSIDVHGSNFDSRIPVFCHFQRILPSKDDSIQNRRIATEEPVKAIYHNNSLVQCPVQSWLTLQDFFSLQNQDWAKNITLLEGAILEISLTTEQDWIHSHAIPYLPTETVISLFPRCAPRSGGTKIRVTGENFVETDSLACRFGSMNAELVRFISTKEIECITPQFNHFGSGAHVVEVQIANNGVDFSSSTESFEFYDHLIIENANPLFGEAQTVIEIYLDDNAMKTKALEKQPDTPSEPFNILSSYANPKCVFNHTDIVDAKVTSPTSLSCAAPLCRNPQGGGVLLQLSANYGFDVVDVGYFIYNAAQNVPFQLEPNHGRKGGGTRVLAKGIVGSFVRDVMPLCRFGSYTSRAADIDRDEGYVVCISPPNSLNNFAPSVSVDISLSGQVFTNFSVVFRYDEEVVVRSLHPSRGFASGGTDIQVLGGPFANNHELKCRFGTNIVNASFHDTNHISCSSPTLDQVHEVQKISVFSMAHNPEIQTISAKSEDYVNEIHTCKTFGDGTDDLRDDEFGRGFILVAPGGSTNYPLKRATRWLRHNETAGTMHEALRGFMPDGFEVSRRGPFARETYEWDIILPKSATFGGETFHVVENGGGRVRIKGTNASANCTLSQAGTQKINGHFKLTFNQNGFEESTSPIRHNATNEEIERALERLEMIHDVIVNSNSIDINDTGSGAYQWHITFNSLRNAGDLPLLKTDFASPDAKLSGTGARIEIIETRNGVSMDVLILTIPWNSDDFSILLNGVEGQILHRGSSASDLQESMVLDFGIESVLVERYESKLNEQDEYYLLDIVGNSIAKDIKVITTGCIEDHSDCFEERRDVSLFSPGNASPFGGHFKIQYAGRITNPIPVFATPSDVESALEELESIGDIIVTITESNRVDEYKVPVTSGHVGECRNFYIQFVQAISSPPEVMNGHKKPHLSTHYSGDLELLQLSEGQIMGVPTRDTAFSDDYQSSVCEVVKGVDYNHGGPVEFAVSINNGADFSMNNPIFHYHAIPTLDSIHPSLGSITGGTTIRVRGSNLLQGFIRSCIFWDTAKAGMAVMTPILEYTSQNEVTCQSPALIDSRNVTVFVV